MMTLEMVDPMFCCPAIVPVLVRPRIIKFSKFKLVIFPLNSLKKPMLFEELLSIVRL